MCTKPRSSNQFCFTCIEEQPISSSNLRPFKGVLRVESQDRVDNTTPTCTQQSLIRPPYLQRKFGHIRELAFGETEK